MSNTKDIHPLPWLALMAVLVGFPVFFYLWSLALLHRSTFTIPGLDFFTGFWIATAAVYAAKTWIVLKILYRSGWTAADIGLPTERKSIVPVIAGYVLLAALALAAVEYAVSQTVFDQEKLASLPGLYPESTEKRIALLVLALFGGVSEEITYRGFAIKGLVSRGFNRWIVIPIAAIPFVFQHGLKSLDQFWWFFTMGVFFGLLFVISKRLLPCIIIHWLVIWAALGGIFSAAVN